ncbi:testis-expressed protein 2-like [Babylonia areolata]|uniref:testis-expressed protein 2-like n=1 Tax=Babylonia areolata TaxID=304850 RepID=UPI003FCFCA22
MSSTSKQKPKPPARPPLPRGNLSLGGISFKKLEKGDEEEEEDLTITDKYSSQLHQPDVIASSDSSSPKNNTPKAGTIVEREEGTASFPLKKGNKTVLEYKELLSGLKGKIQEKITKTIEDSAAYESLSKKLGVGSGTTDSSKERATKAPVSKLQKSSTDPLIRPPVPVMERAKSEEKQDLTENPPPQPVELSLVTDEVSGEENIVVMDKSFMQQPPETPDSNTAIRCRSKPTKNTYSMSRTAAALDLPGDSLRQDVDKKDNISKPDQSEQVDKSSKTDGSLTSPKPKPVWYFISLGGRLSLRQQLLVAMLCFCAFSILPIPSFMAGLIMGCMLSSLCLSLYSYMMWPGEAKEDIPLIPLEDLPPMEIPEMKEATLLDGIYKGWMNEITSYNVEEYHINQTTTVFVTLEGTKLRLQKPKNSVPKRAMHDENISTSQFVEQRSFELKGGRVSLLPPGLVRKRVWSKKYPICIALAEPGTKMKTLGNLSVDLAHSDSSGQGTGLELFPEEKCDTSVLFLFARTGREKEEWFHRFNAATQEKPLANAILEMRQAIERHRQSHPRRASLEGLPLQRRNSEDSQSSTVSDPTESAATEMEIVDPVLEFTRYMGHLMPATTFSQILSPKNSKESGATPRLPFPGSIICDNQLYWLNALIGRCFFDFLRDGWWADKVKDKLQRKLSKIHVPYFIEELQVTAIDLGKEMPVIRRAANPYLDEQGFWVELDVSYSGGFKMTIETKVNLMKLKRNNPQESQSTEDNRSDRSPITDPDEEDSAESSTDDEEEAACPEEKESGGGSKKLLKYLNKLTSSKYFQQATEYKYIKRAMENVSNTPLQLQVSVKNLVGKLAINIPPLPSDRLWYGFRGPPRLSLVAKPQVGERVVTITHITDWIERKLELEFQRVFVMPNMDDLVIPILRAPDDEEQTLNFAGAASPDVATSMEPN